MNKDAERYFNDEEYAQMIIDYASDEQCISAHRTIAATTFLRSIETNIDVLRNAHVKVLVSLQAQLALRDTSLLSSEEKAFSRPDANTLLLYPVVRQEVDSLCSSRNVPFVDIVPFFNDPSTKKQQLFIDYCHLNDAGSAITAAALFPAVENLLFLDRVETTDTLGTK